MTTLHRADMTHLSIPDLRAAIHGYIDKCRLAPGIQNHLADMAESDSGVGKLPLDHGPDLFPQRLRHAILVVLPPSMLRHGPRSLLRTYPGR